MKSKKTSGVILTVCLILGLLFAVKYILEETLFSPRGEELSSGQTVYFEQGDIKELSVELIASDFTVKTGDSFSLSCDSKYIKYYENGGRIVVTEKAHKPSKKGLSGSVVLCIPESIDITRVRFRIGSGNMKADKISCEELSLDYGAGKVEFSSLNASEKAKINCGMGNLIINDGNLNDLSLDIGVGELSLRALLSGESEINGGVGKTAIKLLGGEDMYSFDLDCSLGAIKIGGRSVGEGKYGTGKNEVEINGGIGSITVDFE